MSLGLLYKDELRGYYKSKTMIVLFVGMPLISIFMHFLQPDAEGIPISTLVALLVASLGGTLSSVMLSTTVVNEKSRHVYELFLIRPIKRFHLLLAKFLAVYTCLLIGTIFSLSIGLTIDYFTLEIPLDVILEGAADSLVISLAAMAISCSMGLLIGVLTNSVMLAAILAIYAGNQFSMLAVLPGVILETLDPVLFSLAIGLSATIVIMGINYFVFEKKQF
ncbi:MAG: ABC transporter permease [Promethearchaeota archaeon]